MPPNRPNIAAVMGLVALSKVSVMRVAVIGLGLIGGSVLRALADTGEHDVTGYDADPAVRGLARTAAGQAPVRRRWRVAGSVREASDDSELVVIAVPWPAFAGVVDDLANGGFSGLITDVTSVKGAAASRDRRSVAALRRGARRLRRRAPDGRAARSPASPAPTRRMFRGRAWALCLEPDETPLADWLTVARPSPPRSAPGWCR